MIAVGLTKDLITQKQMVSSWYFVTKEYVQEHPPIPGDRMYVEEKNIPRSFFKHSYDHYYDSGVIRCIYPEKENMDPTSF